MHPTNGRVRDAGGKMGARILTLSLGSFAVGTGAYVVTGVLVDVAKDLSVSVATAGLLVTVFA